MTDIQSAFLPLSRLASAWGFELRMQWQDASCPSKSFVGTAKVYTSYLILSQRWGTHDTWFNSHIEICRAQYRFWVAPQHFFNSNKFSMSSTLLRVSLEGRTYPKKKLQVAMMSECIRTATEGVQGGLHSSTYLCRSFQCRLFYQHILGHILQASHLIEGLFLPVKL